jgi:hypothetical protein
LLDNVQARNILNKKISNRNYPSSRAYEETTTSFGSLGAHLHKAILTMHTFWPRLLPVGVVLERILSAKIMLSLNREAFYRFTKYFRTKTPSQAFGSTSHGLRFPFSFPFPLPLDEPPDIFSVNRRVN